jgi:predicted esterase
VTGAAVIASACGGTGERGTSTLESTAIPAEARPVDGRTALTAAPPGAITFQSVAISDGTVVDFAVSLPPEFDAAREWPTLLALPPGSQTTAMVESGLDRYWSAGAGRGWVVISPAAPGGRLFFEGSESIVGEFLDIVGLTYRPENGRYHLAGVSNGGISAFRVAAREPGRFRSLLVAPGFPLSYADVDALVRLVDLPVAMYVGELDSGWVGPMTDTFASLSAFGAEVTLDVVPGAGHVLRSITGDELFDVLDSHR